MLAAVILSLNAVSRLMGAIRGVARRIARCPEAVVE